MFQSSSSWNTFTHEQEASYCSFPGLENLSSFFKVTFLFHTFALHWSRFQLLQEGVRPTRAEQHVSLRSVREHWSNRSKDKQMRWVTLCVKAREALTVCCWLIYNFNLIHLDMNLQCFYFQSLGNIAVLNLCDSLSVRFDVFFFFICSLCYQINKVLNPMSIKISVSHSRVWQHVHSHAGYKL